MDPRDSYNEFLKTYGNLYHQIIVSDQLDMLDMIDAMVNKMDTYPHAERIWKQITQKG